MPTLIRIGQDEGGNWYVPEKGFTPTRLIDRAAHFETDEDAQNFAIRNGYVAAAQARMQLPSEDYLQRFLKE